VGTGKYGEGWINPTRTRTPGQPTTPVKIGSAFSRRNLHILCRYWRSSAKQKVAYQVGFFPFCRFFSVNICTSENSCTRSSQNSPLWPVFTCEILLGAYICRYSLFFFCTAYFCCNLGSKIYYLCLSAPICTYLLVSTVLCSRSLPTSEWHLDISIPRTCLNDFINPQRVFPTTQN
jgi:hypothetical protein